MASFDSSFSPTVKVRMLRGALGLAGAAVGRRSRGEMGPSLRLTWLAFLAEESQVVAFLAEESLVVL